MILFDDNRTIGCQEAFNDRLTEIVKLLKPEIIICFGTRIRTASTWSPFLGPGVPSARGEYDLLIILRDDDHRRDHEIIDLVDRRNTDTLVLATVVHRLHAVQDALRESSFFFSCLCQQGVPVYGDMALLAGDIPSSAVWPALEGLERQWDRWFGLSRNFLSTAAESASRGWHTLAVFMLHQAVEHACIAIIRVCMGYRPTTHSLSRLLRLVENIAVQISAIFPCATEEEQTLFNVLQKAYSDARYRDVYTISAADVAILIARVRTLHGLFEKLYAEKRAAACVLRG